MTRKKHHDVGELCVEQHAPIREAIAHMNARRVGISFVVDGQQRLTGTVTDGDLRRAILDNIDLDQPLMFLLGRKAAPHARPVSAPADADPDVYLALFQKHNILHLPLLDEEGRVVDMVAQDDFLPGEIIPLQAVIMAGGEGERLSPLTKEEIQ